VAGTKYVHLAVTDANGASDAITQQVAVSSAPTPTPTPTPSPSPTPTPGPGCDRTATPGTLGAEVDAASAGQVICLASGDYGEWAGTDKAITIRSQDGATPTMSLNLTTGDQGFTLDGLTIDGGRITNGARDLTIRNSAFTSHLTFNGVLDSTSCSTTTRT